MLQLKPLLLCAIVFGLSATNIVQAVEYTGAVNTTESTIISADSLWPSSGITGWNYVGQIGQNSSNNGGASGIYLGNGWVITAGHVGAGNFTLNNTTYSMVVGSAVSLTLSAGVAGNPTATISDLTMFQISSNPGLSALSISNSQMAVGTPFVLIGYGTGNNSRAESWGYNTVAENDVQVSVDGYPYYSEDFDSLASSGSGTGTVTSYLQDGDSGGADFVYSNGVWILAGMNEAIDKSTNTSYYVDLSSYSAEITSIMSAPEPGEETLFLTGVVSLFVALNFRRRARIQRRSKSKQF